LFTAGKASGIAGLLDLLLTMGDREPCECEEVVEVEAMKEKLQKVNLIRTSVTSHFIMDFRCNFSPTFNVLLHLISVYNWSTLVLSFNHS